MPNIEVIDDIFPISLQNEIENILINPEKNFLSWNYLNSTVPDKKQHITNTFITEETKDFKTMTIIMYEKRIKTIEPNIFDSTTKLFFYHLEKYKKKRYFSNIRRFRANLCFKDGSYPKNFHSIPHIDHKFSDGLLYYVNDSDGDTFFFNETINDLSENKKLKLTLNRRVTPKKGRLVLYDSNIFHAGSLPRIHDTRVVLNGLFYKERVNNSDINNPK